MIMCILLSSVSLVDTATLALFILAKEKRHLLRLLCFEVRWMV